MDSFSLKLFLKRSNGNDCQRNKVMINIASAVMFKPGIFGDETSSDDLSMVASHRPQYAPRIEMPLRLLEFNTRGTS